AGCSAERICPEGSTQFGKPYPDGQRVECHVSIDGVLTPHGPCIEWYRNGQKKQEYHTAKGKLNGPFILWHENGKKKLEGRYVQGKKEGQWNSWYKGGKPKLFSHFVDGKEEGHHIHYFPDGQKAREGEYRAGEKFELWTEWYENGNKKEESEFKGNAKHGRITQWNEDGSMKAMGAYDYNRKTGDWVIHYPSGRKLKYQLLNNLRHGSYVSFDKSGQKIEEGSYLSGKMEGKWTQYHAGRVIKTAEYKAGSAVFVERSYSCSVKDKGVEVVLSCMTDKIELRVSLLAEKRSQKPAYSCVGKKCRLSTHIYIGSSWEGVDRARKPVVILKGFEAKGEFRKSFAWKKLCRMKPTLFTIVVKGSGDIGKRLGLERVVLIDEKLCSDHPRHR
ncbi:MAG: toxin-antitoxin system YwqK family antitoxin, partial [Deltaproteobacteria bacterium]|nr:toxin-antitoxin system YwqK family antitoxin [Deltaproteobacteria bacterium]